MWEGASSNEVEVTNLHLMIGDLSNTTIILCSWMTELFSYICLVLLLTKLICWLKLHSLNKMWQIIKSLAILLEQLLLIFLSDGHPKPTFLEVGHISLKKSHKKFQDGLPFPKRDGSNRLTFDGWGPERHHFWYCWKTKLINSRSGHYLNSILLTFTIKNRCKKVCFQQTHYQGLRQLLFPSWVRDGDKGVAGRNGSE